MKYHLLIFSLLIICARSLAAPHANRPENLRTDLYSKIGENLGLTLKDAYHALNDDPIARSKLFKFAEAEGFERFKAASEKQIESLLASCQAARMTEKHCQDDVEGLEQALIENSKEHSDFRRSETSTEKKLSWSLYLFAMTIKDQILGRQYIEWAKTCTSAKKLNTSRCKQGFLELSHIDDIGAEIAVLGRFKTEGQKSRVEQLEKIREKIKLYEKI